MSFKKFFMKTKNYFWKANIYTFSFVLVNEILSISIEYNKVSKKRVNELIDQYSPDEYKWDINF